MASSDVLKSMFTSYRRGDHVGFNSAARQMISEERRKHHHVLANELERLLEYNVQRRPLHSATLRPLPKAKDEHPLLDLANPERSLHELVLPKETFQLLDDVCAEFTASDMLGEAGIGPRSRLLFVGPPGCGKSVTAEALGTELGIPLARVHLGAVVSSFLGETARNLEAIFEFCSHGSWVMIFDEFDALAKERGDRSDHGELKRVVAAFLQMIDSFRGRSLIVATTNHPALLDAAVWRRFNDVVGFELPDHDARISLLKVKLKAVPSDINIAGTAELLAGLSHAEIEMVCHDAIRHALLDHRGVVAAADIDYALKNAQRRWQTIRNFRSD